MGDEQLNQYTFNYLFIKTFTFTVQEEIDERRGFLKEMEDLGQGGKYRPIIETEISQVKGNNYV